MAWHGLGWEPAFFSDIEAFPCAVLQHHYPEVPLHGDFTTIKDDDYGPIDLLVGGTRANPSQSQDSEAGWMMNAVTWLSNSLSLLNENVHSGSFGKMSTRLVLEWRTGLWLLPRGAG